MKLVLVQLVASERLPQSHFLGCGDNTHVNPLYLPHFSVLVLDTTPPDVLSGFL